MSRRCRRTEERRIEMLQLEALRNGVLTESDLVAVERLAARLDRVVVGPERDLRGRFTGAEEITDIPLAGKVLEALVDQCRRRQP